MSNLLWESLCDAHSQLPVHLAMLLAQLLSGGYYVITKVAFVSGMHPIVLSVYRDLLAICVLLPAAYFIDHKRIQSFSVLFRLLLLGVTWIFGSQLLLFLGISYTSADFSAAMQPCIPVFTAMIAIAFGIEKVIWSRRDGQAKVAGIVVCCTGAAVMAFYRGPSLVGMKSHAWMGLQSAFQRLPSLLWMQGLSSEEEDVMKWQLGALCLVGNCMCMAVAINIQVPLFREFPHPLSVTAYSYILGVVMIGIAGIFLVDDEGEWKLSWNSSLLAIFYNGIIASAVNFGLMAWCVKRVGQLFVASYIPVQPIISAILDSIFLGNKIYLSSFIGTSLILAGLFLVSCAQVQALKLASNSTDIEADNLGSQNIKFSQNLLEPLIGDETKVKHQK